MRSSALQLRVGAGAAKNLAGLWIVSLFAFAYMGVPIINSILFSSALVTQASIGAVAMSQILGSLRLSLFILCGPCLVIGGALSGVFFQSVGSGLLGAVVMMVVGIAAVARVITTLSWSTGDYSHLFGGTALLGLTAIAISWEFEEFLFPGLTLLVASAVGERWIHTRPRMVTVAMVFMGAILAAFLSFREDFWWLVTDDYLFLEVLAQHLGRSNPLQNWGVMNWASYHWLSYGWSGMLNQLGGQPEVLLTLTRVMPVVYSLSLGASLLCLAVTLQEQLQSRTWWVISAGAMVLFNRLDWTGTSTAGAFAVIAASVVLLLQIPEENTPLIRRHLLYVTLATLIAFTKFSSLLVMIPVFVLIEYCAQKRCTCWHGSSARSLVVVLGGMVISLVAIAIAGETLGRFIFTPLYPDFTLVNPRAPVAYSITQLGVAQTLLAVLMTRLWLLLTLFVTVFAYRDMFARPKSHVIATLSALVVSGVLTDTFVFGDSNAHEYFSGPLYFVATLSLIFTAHSHSEWSRYSNIGRLALFSLGSFLFSLGWEYSIVQVSQPMSSNVSAFVLILSDNRLGAVLFITSLLIFVRADSTTVKILPKSLLVSLLVIVLAGSFSVPWDQPQAKHTDATVAEILGPPEVIATGQWISENVPENDRLATNYILVQPPESNYADWGLAAWSNREFLVLDVDGPWFDESSPRHIRARYLSEAFAESPTLELAKELIADDVRWFVVDRRTTNQLTWYPFASARFAYEHFVVLQLNDTLN